MKITSVEVVQNKHPVPLPEPYVPAWLAPNGKPRTGLNFSFYRVHTDAGITGFGPATGFSELEKLQGFDPFRIGEFYNAYMGRKGNGNHRATGIEIELWDIVGKAANLPVYNLPGAHWDRIPVFAASVRLLDMDQHIRQAQKLIETGFRAVKLRPHREDPKDDLAVVEAVREAVGKDVQLLVDANQSNESPGYAYWSRSTALEMVRHLEELDVYFLEDPLPNGEVEGLAEICDSVEMYIAGGEHLQAAHEFKAHWVAGIYDIVQPDVAFRRNIGICGMRDVASLADHFDRLVCPHVSGNGTTPLAMAATLQAMATAPNCPMMEYVYDPPILTPKTNQFIAREPLLRYLS